MAIYQVNYQGLRKRSDYDDLVDYVLFKQPKIQYPNRMAKFIRESPQLSNLLDGEGMGIEALKLQQFNRMKEEQKQHAIIESASESGGTAQELRSLSRKSNSSIISDAVSDYSNSKQDFNEDLLSLFSDEEATKQKKVDEYSSMFVNDPGHDHTRQLEEIMKFNLDFTPSVSSGNGNGNGTPPVKESSSSAYPKLDAPKLILHPPSSSSPAVQRNPNEPRPKGRPPGSKNKTKDTQSSASTIPKASAPKKSVLQRVTRSSRKRIETPKVLSPIDYDDL